MSRRVQGGLYAGLAAAIWGGMYVVSKAVLAVIGPLPLVWLRYVTALLLLAPWAWRERSQVRLTPRAGLLIGIVGVLGYGVSILAQFAGTARAGAAWGAVVTATTPAFLLLLAHGIRQEPVSRRQLLGLGLALAGVWALTGAGGGRFLTGTLLLLLAAATWAGAAVAVQALPAAVPPATVTAFGIGLATLLLTPAALPTVIRDATSMLRPLILAGVLYLGLVATGLAFLWWNRGLQLAPAAVSGAAFFLQPLTGSLLGWTCLGERPTAAFLAGLLGIVAGGLLLVQTPAAARPAQPRPAPVHPAGPGTPVPPSPRQQEPTT
ncbi:Permease of the drug/metabolite transporter (DMT) superfamily [Candidatus Hydrogenisulfobacillus filiaventi]|uniref:Permease of the drug/metabolite transporter (DMT) superfamily n=1 Tax=Candidatus Hydrogenisulfobacillus filiaventi TaxID=2707344 RepID=A0A6F8ZHL9_9FIRM|nr:Permease of the drug/metabolite transporter (DMT) superfamily [Candidatus Hydrogenisulfobacillus filiaventi]